MTGADLVLAAMLLTVPPGTPAGCPDTAEWPGLRDAVHQVAVEWEILDPKETRYVLTKPEDFCTDLNMLRRRRIELADAPRVSDSKRFPDRTTVNELVRFNRCYDKHIKRRAVAESDRAAALEVVLDENERLYKIWDAVRDSRCDYYYVTVRRQALKKLRDLIGEEAYEAGELPPNVPTWRFVELN